MFFSSIRSEIGPAAQEASAAPINVATAIPAMRNPAGMVSGADVSTRLAINPETYEIPQKHTGQPNTGHHARTGGEHPGELGSVGRRAQLVKYLTAVKKLVRCSALEGSLGRINTVAIPDTANSTAV